LEAAIQSDKKGFRVMPIRLSNSTRIRTLARDLKLDLSSTDAVTAILGYCTRRIAKFLKDFPNTSTLEELQQVAAARLGTVFEMIRSDADLLHVKQKYVSRAKREPAFANLENELPDHVFGVTFRLVHADSWELPFISVIDCRGEKAAREYFTKWHEIAHLLTLTDQGRLKFYRSHSAEMHKDPEESLADTVASRMGFYSPIIRPFAVGNLTFENIQILRTRLCPTASREAAIIGFVQAWPRPSIYIWAELALRKADERLLQQERFSFSQAPIRKLRAITVVANDAAKSTGNVMRRNWRVPERSIIQRVYAESDLASEAREDLSWWGSSDGTVLDPCWVSVEARKSWNAVEALIHPDAG
jgi:hypothetical protein